MILKLKSNRLIFNIVVVDNLAYFSESRSRQSIAYKSTIIVFLDLKRYSYDILESKRWQDHPLKPGIKRRLLHTNNLMMVAIEFEGGPWDKPDPLHDRVHEQITYVAEGEVIFFSEGEPDQVLRKGDMVSIPSQKKHAIQLMSLRAVLIDSFNPPREDFL